MKRGNEKREDEDVKKDEGAKEEREEKKVKHASTDSLYLDTINRHLLDFDLDRLCSVTLSPLSLYMCLSCGKYLSGKSQSSPAYFHSLESDHHVFLQLDTLKVFVLPDGYHVIHHSFDDIKRVANPRYISESLALLDSHPIILSKTLDQTYYHPGFIGLSGVKGHDYVNVCIQMLAHCRVLRDHFLVGESKDDGSEGGNVGNGVKGGRESKRSALVSHFELLLRKIWNKYAFKGHCSPQSLLQEIYSQSKKRFKILEQSDPVDFLVWFLNALKTEVIVDGNGKKENLIGLFQGIVRVRESAIGGTDHLKQLNERAAAKDGEQEGVKEKVLPFTVLQLDLPPVPLFQDEFERNIIPQISIDALLKKYDGKTYTTTSGNVDKRFAIMKSPKYLVVNIKRIVKNGFSGEKNCTMMNFPLRGLQVPITSTSHSHTTTALDTENLMNGEEFQEETVKMQEYDLISTITHTGDHIAGTYSLYTCTASKKQWFKIQDLLVESVGAQEVFLSEACLQVWERV